MENILLGLAGTVLSAIFKYWPAAEQWYNKQANKGLLMLAFVFVLSGLYFGASCLPLDLGVTAVCSEEGALEVVKAFVVILVGNQLAYLTLPNKAAG